MGQEATALDTPRSQEGCANEDGEEVRDLFKPLPPLPACAVGKEVRPLTIRSVALGLIFGSLVSASNVYLGLKTGFVFSANMFGAIFGFGVARFLSQTLAHVPVLGNGGVFGPTENNMIQATASGADGLSGFFVAAVPAMYRLSLLSDPEGANPVLRDFGKLIWLTLVCAMLGLCWAVPFRKFFIVHVARELKFGVPKRLVSSSGAVYLKWSLSTSVCSPS
jgi:uncharacterized oligopeptide transporter (OPT) family protein